MERYLEQFMITSLHVLLQQYNPVDVEPAYAVRWFKSTAGFELSQQCAWRFVV